VTKKKIIKYVKKCFPKGIVSFKEETVTYFDGSFVEKDIEREVYVGDFEGGEWQSYYNLDDAFNKVKKYLEDRC